MDHLSGYPIIQTALSALFPGRTGSYGDPDMAIDAHDIAGLHCIAVTQAISRAAAVLAFIISFFSLLIPGSPWLFYTFLPA